MLICGWAHERTCLAPIADSLSHDIHCTLYAPPDLMLSDATAPASAISDPAFIVGWSLGGLIALQKVLRQTWKPQALVLISSTARFCSAHNYPCGASFTALRAMKIALRHAPAAALSQFHRLVWSPQEPSPDDTREFVSCALAQDVNVLCSELDYLLETDLRSDLQALTVPILLLHGQEDAVIPWHASEFIARTAPRSQFVTFPRAGHSLPLTASSDIAHHIGNFLNCAVG